MSGSLDRGIKNLSRRLPARENVLCAVNVAGPKNATDKRRNQINSTLENKRNSISECVVLLGAVSLQDVGDHDSPPLPTIYST